MVLGFSERRQSFSSSFRTPKFHFKLFFQIPHVLESPPPHQLDDSASPTYRQTEICADTSEVFEQIYIRVNTYRKNKNTSKIK